MNQDKLSTHTQVQKTKSPQIKKIWQKPHVQKLNVSLDTAATGGSGGDGFMQTSIN